MNNFSKKKIQLIILMLFWFVMLFVCRPFDKSEGMIQEVRCYDPTVIGSMAEMIQDTEIQQNFTAKHDQLKSIQFTTGTYDRVNSGELQVVIAEAASGKSVYSTSIDVSTVPDVDWVTIDVPENTIVKGTEYVLKFKANSSPESAIVLISSHTDKLPGALVNNVPVDSSLRMNFTYHDTGVLKLRLLAWLFVMILSVFLVVFVKKADEKGFLLIAIVIGLIFVFANPFPHLLDESTHYFRSFMISQGNMIDDLNEDGKIGGYVSDNYGEVIDETMNIESLVNDNADWMKKYTDTKEFYYNPYMSSYNPINHLVGAIGIWIGNLFHLPAVFCIYFGRIITLACYIIMAYIAIKKAEYYKGVFFCVSTLPIALFLASSFSADPILMGASIMFISICLKYRFNSEQKISRGELFLLLVGVIFIASSKYLIYVPVLLLFFVIPKKCFSDNKTYRMELVIAVIIILIFAGIAVYLLKKFDYVEDRNGHVDMREQLEFLLKNKIRGLGYLIDSFFETLFSNLSHIGFYLPALSPVGSSDLILYPAIILFAAAEDKKYSFAKKRDRVILSTLFAAIIFVIYSMTVGALYLAFTPVGGALADGVQPRYLLPIMPMVLMLISFLIPLKSEEHKISDMIPITMILVCLNAVCGVLASTFI